MSSSLHSKMAICQTQKKNTTLHFVSWNSQIKHPITSLWYASTMSRSYVAAMPCFYYGPYYVFKLLCLDLHPVGFHFSFKYQIKHQIFLVPTRRQRRSSLGYKLVELLLHLKRASYINNICNISCADT